MGVWEELADYLLAPIDWSSAIVGELKRLAAQPLPNGPAQPGPAPTMHG
jgi:hypothetical protein